MKNIFSPTMLALLALTFVVSFVSGCEQAHVTPPLTFQMRTSYVNGYVLQITNRAQEHLECSIYVINKERTKQSKTYRCVINSGATQEIGFVELDGWYLEPGEKAIISVVGYACDMEVTWNENGEYTWGIYVD